jgi:hypothetical protein
MTNEEILEEILHESHELGFDKQIFEVVKTITRENPKMDRVNVYQMALNLLKKNEELVYSAE